MSGWEGRRAWSPSRRMTSVTSSWKTYQKRSKHTRTWSYEYSNVSDVYYCRCWCCGFDCVRLRDQFGITRLTEHPCTSNDRMRCIKILLMRYNCLELFSSRGMEWTWRNIIVGWKDKKGIHYMVDSLGHILYGCAWNLCVCLLPLRCIHWRLMYVSDMQLQSISRPLQTIWISYI